MEETGEVSHHLLYPKHGLFVSLVIVKLILWIQCPTKGCDTNQTLEVDRQALSGDHMWSRDWGMSVHHKKYISARSTPESPCSTLEKQYRLP